MFGDDEIRLRHALDAAREAVVFGVEERIYLTGFKT
jgi:hypothetical protein